MARKKLSKVSIFVAIFCCFAFAMSFLTGCGDSNGDNTMDEPTIDDPIQNVPEQDEPVVEEKPTIQKLPMNAKYVTATVRRTPGDTYTRYGVEWRFWQVDISVSPLKSNIVFQDVRVLVGWDKGRGTWVTLNDQGYGTASYTTSCQVGVTYNWPKDIYDTEGYVLISE